VPTVDQIIETAFHPGRTPRSDEYKAGVRAVLEFWANNRGNVRSPKYPDCPHQAGTAQADAWYAGAHEGRMLSLDAGLQIDAIGNAA